MEQSVEITNIKNESNDLIPFNRTAILSEMKSNCIKQEKDGLVQSEIYIKTEVQENESEFPVIAGTSDEMCPDDDNEFKIYEPIVNIEMENSEDEITHDSLTVKADIKVKEHFTSKFDGEKENNKKVAKEKVEYRPNFNEDESVQNKLMCKVNKHQCDVCTKTFDLRGNLNKHLRIHTGEKLFICEVCKKSFTHKGTLDRHLLIHSGEKAYVCDVCNTSFSRKSTLNNHKLVHSGEKPFLCIECNKSFKRKQDYAMHRRIHTNDKPYACDLCDRAFAQKANLLNHKRIHAGDKPFTCDTCGRAFTQKSDLTRHKRIHIKK